MADRPLVPDDRGAADRAGGRHLEGPLGPGPLRDDRPHHLGDHVARLLEDHPVADQHPKRPIEGFACRRSEVSGRRLWGLFAAKFGTPENFFAEHFVVNFCPLAFMDEGGRNLTPDKLGAADTEKLFAACDEHLRQVVATTRAEWVIGVGDFAEKRAREALGFEAGTGLEEGIASTAAWYRANGWI